MKLTKQVNFKLCVLFVMGTVAFANAQIPEDKKLHFAAGNIAGAVGYTWSYKKHQDKKRAIVAGICTAFAAGVMKEMFDASTGGYVEHGDVLATTLGGITISTTIPLFSKKKKYRRLDKWKGGYKYN
jgi:uncharacterized protein YfiM (DUF2279 family)|tara:strand:- start:35 stop:415 length:381 start_codon:yes stop_codon:yes gene_type:complete